MTEKRGLKCLLYAGILLCFVLMFFFIVPQSDMFLFARDTEPTLQSAALGAYGYGNGRFLGNLAGMFLSHYFVLAFLPLSLCLTGMIWLVNRIVFSGVFTGQSREFYLDGQKAVIDNGRFETLMKSAVAQAAQAIDKKFDPQVTK